MDRPYREPWNELWLESLTRCARIFPRLCRQHPENIKYQALISRGYPWTGTGTPITTMQDIGLILQHNRDLKF